MFAVVTVAAVAPVVPGVKLANAAATCVAVVAPAAVKVSPFTVTACPAVNALKVKTVDSVTPVTLSVPALAPLDVMTFGCRPALKEANVVDPVKSTLLETGMPVAVAGTDVRLSVSSSSEINWVFAVVNSSLTSLYVLI